MNIKSNFHTHTYRCLHATGTEEEYVLSAINNNLDVLGISDHAPYPDDRFDFRMKYNELEEYLNTLNNLKIKYSNKITIYSGLEIEYDEHFNDYYNYLLNTLKFDYLALGQHIFYEDSKICNSFQLSNTHEYIAYANSIVEAMKTGFFKFLCHPDLIFINDFPWDDNCDLACNIIIEGAKKYDMILEFNGNGLRKGLMNFKDGNRYPYPHLKFWNKVSKTDLKVIINSDCHSPKELVDNNTQLAYDMAKSLNLKLLNTIF